MLLPRVHRHILDQLLHRQAEPLGEHVCARGEGGAEQASRAGPPVAVGQPCGVAAGRAAVESVQQVGGNLVSALMVPVAEWALNQDYEFFRKSVDVRGDVVLLFAVAAVTIVYFNTFDAPLRRTLADEASGTENSERLLNDGVADMASEGLDDAPLKMEQNVRISGSQDENGSVHELIER